jgi:ArsR family transcriptional regulator, arsenate/arsenite/antimonite-responsive transcriptional repressor / arsenate reductase (thioredoxin)
MSEHTPVIIKLLSNDLRWNLLKALAQSDMRVQELSELLGQPQNLVSYHLQKLRDHALVLEHHSIADGREVYYGTNLHQIRDLFKAAEGLLHPAITREENSQSLFPPLRVLFLCTHNSARSQIAEAFLRTKSQAQIQAFSAGTEPISVNPFTKQVMKDLGIDIQDQKAKGLDQFQNDQFDYIVTVCDRARVLCPLFPGNPIKIHWSIADPTAVNGSQEDQYQAFRQTAKEMSDRMDNFLAGIRHSA